MSEVSGWKTPARRRLVAGAAAAALLCLIGAWQFDRISTGAATSPTSSTGRAGVGRGRRSGRTGAGPQVGPPAAGRRPLPVPDGGPAKPNQRFRLEPTGGDGYRIRPASSGRCLAVNGGDGEPGAEAVERPCASAAGQTFLIDSE
ncbi:RICIN domain-containing protein [Microbispora siamensis]